MSAAWAVGAYVLANGGVDGALLQLSCRAVGERPAPWRLVLAAALGAAWALVSGQAASPAVSRLLGPVVLMLPLGLRPPGRAVARLGAFTGLSVALGGTVLGLWALITGRLPTAAGAAPLAGPAAAAVLCLVGPVLVTRLRQGLARRAATERVRLLLRFGRERLVVKGILDSGNRLRDPLGGAPVVVVEARALAGAAPAGLVALAEAAASRSWPPLSDDWRRRLRMVPFASVGGRGVLWGVRADAAFAAEGGSLRPLGPAVVAFAAAPLGLPDGAAALVPTDLWRAARTSKSAHLGA
jgi:stage II sporulation protein GA (sporulation sigma-E factor processing peptidase)